jgi:hypothetical protein
VQRLTGKVVDDESVDMATGIIEIVSGADADLLNATNLSARNLKWLRYAVAYQCAFMIEHPDYFTRMDVTSMTQDGASATLRADGLVLAPNARRCLKRLSWRGVRTVQAVGEFNHHNRFGSLTNDDFFDTLDWKPSA